MMKNGTHHYREVQPLWLTISEVAALLRFSPSKTKMLVASGEIRSVKDGGHRRILPEWVEEYITRRVHESEAA